MDTREASQEVSDRLATAERELDEFERQPPLGPRAYLQGRDSRRTVLEGLRATMGGMTSEHPQQPLVSIDTVPFVLRDGSLHVVVARRIFEPFLGQEALPGVLLLANERLAEAAVRALETKAGVRPEHVLALRQTAVFDDFDRDPRGPTLSIVHVAALAQHAVVHPERARAVPIAELGHLPFDHDAIVQRAAVSVADALLSDTGLARALLGERFTTADAARLARELAAAAGRGRPDTSNFARVLAKLPGLVKADADGLPVRGPGFPAAGWAWED